MKINLVDKNGVTLKTAGTYVKEDLEVGLSESDKSSLVSENILKDKTILGVPGTHECERTLVSPGVIPNSGDYTSGNLEISFINNLSKEKMYSIFEQLTFIENTALLPDPFYIVLANNTLNRILLIQKFYNTTTTIEYAITVNDLTTMSVINVLYTSGKWHVAGFDISDIVGAIEAGWYENQYVYPIISVLDDETIGKTLISEYSGMPIGAQNDILMPIMSASHAVSADSHIYYKHLQSESVYEGSPITITEPGKVDIASMINEGKLPLSVNVETSGGEVTVSYDTKNPIPADDTTIVNTINFNTNMSNSEVAEILSSIEFTQMDDTTYINYAFVHPTSNIGIGIIKDMSNVASPNFVILLIGGDFGEGTPIYMYSSGGWQSTAVSSWEINLASVSSVDGLVVGVSNELLVDIMYVGGSGTATLSGSYDGTSIKTEEKSVDLLTYIEQNKLPMKVNFDIKTYKEWLSYNSPREVEYTAKWETGAYKDVLLMIHSYKFYNQHNMTKLTLNDINALGHRAVNYNLSLTTLVLNFLDETGATVSPQFATSESITDCPNLKVLAILTKTSTTVTSLKDCLDKLPYFAGISYKYTDYDLEREVTVNENLEKTGIIYVTDSLVDDFKTNYPDYADQIKPYSEYVEA